MTICQREIIKFAGAGCSNKNTARTCENILSQGKSLWLFMNDLNVAATNNLAERQLRPLVIAKKLSFGVKSVTGARFIERIFSFVLSCKQQGKEVMLWLQSCIDNYFKSQPAPIFIT